MYVYTTFFTLLASEKYLHLSNGRHSEFAGKLRKMYSDF